MKTFADVIEFNQKIIGLKPVPYLNPERLQWFKNTINEELGEFVEANEKYKMDYEASKKITVSEDQLLEDQADMIDAIMDLIYFALGRLYEIGCTEDDFAAMWDAIQHANMTKKRGNKGRGSDDDAIKPEGWQGPEQTFINYKKGLKNQLDTCEETTRRFKTTCEKISLNTPNNASDLVKNTNNYEVRENVQQLHLPGMKYDEGKPNLSLVFSGFSKSLVDVGQIGTFGARKYTPNGWKEVDNLGERYMSAMLRHTMAVLDNSPFDNETGRHHLAHVAWNALAILQHLFDTKINYEAYNKSALAQSEKTLREHFETLKEKNNG